MSEATLVIPETRDTQKFGKRLTEEQKRAIVAAVAVNGSIQQVAQQFGVNRNTVAKLVKGVRENVKESAFSSGWRQKLTEELPAKSVRALELSITDTEDVHKAAATGIAHLKGIGVLQNEGATSINVLINQVNGLPADWQERYVSLDSQPIDTPQVVNTPHPDGVNKTESASD